MKWQAGDRVQCDLAFTEIQLDASSGVPDGYIAGIASTPSTDRHGHKVLAKAFDESIKKKGLAGPGGVQLLIGHDWNKVGGKIKKLETINNNLMLEAQLYLDVGYVKDIHTVLKHNGGLNFSVGFSLEDFSFNDTMENEDDPWLIVQKGDLMEVSIVTFPSQADAKMTYVKQLDTMMEFEKALVADGLCQSRQHAHKVARWAIKNVHLLQPKAPPAGDEATALHPLLDVSALKPMADLIAKARAALT
jgi:HK97 family phage prohead protease